MTLPAQMPVPAKPFLKFVGGKRQLLPELLKRVPDEFGTYYEPFVGGGALFFELAGRGRLKNAVLSDVNERLIRTYLGVKNEPARVIAYLQSYAQVHCREKFEETRQVRIDKAVRDAAVAGWIIYLNRTCFNGLYRVNKKGEFNVPFGRYENPTICDEETIMACSAALAGARLHIGDFQTVARDARRGDFVYFDPPYAPVSNTSDFTAYDKAGFSFNDQRRLRDFAWSLKARGVHVLLSNSDSPVIRKLYGGSWKIEEVSARRNINSKASKRGAVTELLIT